MNTGQMLLASGALILLGTTVITVNRMYSQHGTILRKTEVGVYAVSLATSVIEEASGQNFDEATVNSVVTAASSCTASTSFGPDASETGSSAATPTDNFDDFDDYHNLTWGVNVAGVDTFTVKAKVYYVNDTTPDVTTTTKTFYKRIDVSVYSRSMVDTTYGRPDTIKMSYVFSYFNFR